jgi:hypothetical protein
MSPMITPSSRALFLSISLLVTGCAGAPQPTASPSAIAPRSTSTPSPTPSTRQSPGTTAESSTSGRPEPTAALTSAPSQAPNLTPKPSATAVQSALATIDAFWSPMIDLGCWEMIIDKQWNSVEAMTKDTELIVTGKPVGLREDFDSRYGVTVRVVEIEIDEVLKGKPITEPGGRLLAVIHRPGPVDQSIPPQEHLLFLQNVGSDEIDNGDTPTEKQRSWYWLSGMFQNVFADVDGRVAIPMINGIRTSVGEHAFPVELQGEAFDELVETVQRAVANQSDAARLSSFLRHRPLFAC